MSLLIMEDIKVVIIDFGLGNLFSVKQACIHANIPAVISSEKRDILAADALILPGVGAFHEAMQNLHKLDLVEPIRHKASGGIPLFGICLGQQLLFTESEEFGSGKGLNIIPGSIKRFPSIANGTTTRIPQIAWNKIEAVDNSWHNTPFNQLQNGDYMYFVHSYFVSPERKSCVLSETDYAGTRYSSSVLQNNIFATQFHPEKSAAKGLTIYQSWAKQIGVYAKREKIA